MSIGARRGLLSVVLVASCVASAARAGIPGLITTPADEIRLAPPSTSLSLRLERAPHGDVTVYFAHRAAQLDRCSVTFTPVNWSSPQLVHLANVPVGADSSGPRAMDLDLVIKAPGDPALDGQKTQLRTVVEAGRGRTCTAAGGEVRTAGSATIRPALGTTILWRSRSFELQARFSETMGVRPAAVAVRSGSSVVILDLAHWVPPHLPLAGWHEVLGAHGQPLAKSGALPDQVHLKTDHGEVLQVDRHAAPGRGFLDLRATIPDTDHVEGLCGRVQGPPGPPVDRNGAAGPHDEVARSWLAAPDEDLFSCGKRCAQPPRAVSVNLCRIPPR